MLTELQVKSVKPKAKPFMLRDDRGLYLRIDPSGRKYWILRYWEQCKEHQLSLGTYPNLSLKEARMKRDEIQTARAKGQSPSQKSIQQNFTQVTREWLNIRMADKDESYIQTINYRLKKYINPAIGAMPLKEITSSHVLNICRQIENTGHDETAKRVKTIIGQVFRFAIAAGYTDTDPTAALLGALRPKNNRHFATLTNPQDIAILIRAIKAYSYNVMRCALLFSIYTAARPGEIRSAEWAEIHNDTWDIPAVKMKMKRRHIVPLSQQVKAVLDELRPITGSGKWLFPSPRNDGRCMSENGVRSALRAMGFTKEQITPHGFRAIFSTIANENGITRDEIERQLQWWSDYLDGLK